MKIPDILRHFGAFGFFELPNLLALTQAKRATVNVTLHRWAQEGLIIPLRRGLYAFPEDIAKNPMTAERAANQIQKGTYVTGLWVLNQEGLIPEGVTEVTNATLGNPAEFDTALGRYAYQHIQTQGFFGFETKLDAGGYAVRVALPEKALLDLFWWHKTEWDRPEFERWRVQDPFGRLNTKRLRDFAQRWDQPRLIRAAENLTTYLKAA
jgi:hypothetical protein